MKILLTGASGYVGSELLVELRAVEQDVWCLTRSTACPPGVPTDHHIVHDLRSPILLDVDDFDVVVHAAGANDVQSRDPAQALELTALTTRHVAQFAARQRARRLAYVSTFQVYGSDEGTIDEFTPCHPVNDYALTHRFAEEWVELYARTSGLQYVLLRPANIAGIPRTGGMDRWSLTPGCFCRDAMREQRIVVRSTGLQQRDFLPLAEIARRCTDVISHFDTYANQPVNIHAGVSITIGDLARLSAGRYALHAGGANCGLEFRPPPGASDNPPPALAVKGAWLNRHPEARLSREQIIALMTTCIDDTYHHLCQSLRENRSPA